MVIWITGLSASGKTTLASALTAELRERGHPVVLLDGDVMRAVLGEQTTYTRPDRLGLGHTYARVAKMVADQGFVTVVATIAMFREIHAWNRANMPAYFEIYLKVPLDELRRRDPKGLYRRFDRGEIRDVAGLDLHVDEPEDPHLRIEFQTGQTPKRVLEITLEGLGAYAAKELPASAALLSLRGRSRDESVLR